MESLDLLNLRASECSFLEIALTDVRRFMNTFVLEDKKLVVLVFPPLSPRYRFLLHTLVQNFFNELNTISIGCSYGRRTVVYHSSLKPMLRETELEEPNKVHYENDSNIQRIYRTPNERKAQEKLLQSLLPKKKVDKSLRSTQHKRSKRPDIPIYVPKALRGLANNTVLNTINTNNDSNLSLTDKFYGDSSTQQDSHDTSDLKQANGSTSQSNRNELKLLDSINSVDFTNKMHFDDKKALSFDHQPSQISESPSLSNLQCDQFDAGSNIQQGSYDLSGSKQTNELTSKFKLSALESSNSFHFIGLTNDMHLDEDNALPFDHKSSQISESSSSSNLSDFVNTIKCNSISSISKESNSNSSMLNQIIETKCSTSEHNKSEPNTVESHKIDSISMALDVPQNLSDNVSDICSQNSTIINAPDSQTSDNNCEIIFDDNLESQKDIKSVGLKVCNESDKTTVERNISIEQNHETDLGSTVISSNASDIKLINKHNTNCPHYCLDDSLSSGESIGLKKNNVTDNVEELSFQENPVVVTEPVEIIENNNEKKSSIKKKKKKKKKQVLDVDECSWEDLYDKEDEYIHPLLMKELVSTMGKVQVQCTKEDYRSHQTIEERSGDGECVIEVYGFSSDLKTVDLMNQFAAYRKNHFEIVWVNDTHALAVFESPHLADQALNTPFALVKTRPLKNAIKESKIKAETVAPLPATRPKTCSALARRLVSSALGLKLNVSPDLLNAERTLLANAKEKKIRDSQLKHQIWNNES